MRAYPAHLHCLGAARSVTQALASPAYVVPRPVSKRRSSYSRTLHVCRSGARDKMYKLLMATLLSTAAAQTLETFVGSRSWSETNDPVQSSVEK